jgi:transcriptional regulator with XRE-family HTH domain
MSLGEQIRSARAEAGLTQEQLASAAGIDRAYISQLENDHKSPTVDMLLMLCGALGVRASKLIAEIEPAESPVKPARRKSSPQRESKPKRYRS